MDKEDILKKCCTKTCSWNNPITCHNVILNHINLTGNDCKFLSTICVHTLKLFNNNIDPDCAKYLARNKTIHTLELNYNNIGDNGAKYLARNNTIHTLNLGGNEIGDDGAKYLSENETIHTLDLNYNEIRNNGAKYLAKNNTIHTLDLSINNIGPDGAKYFLKAIIPNLIFDYDYIGKTSKDNYEKYMQEINNIIQKYIIKDITNIIISYTKH